MIRSKRIFVIVLVIVTCLGCDQTTKTIASRTLPPNKPIVLIDRFFQLEYTENSGAMLGVGSELSGNVRFWLLRVFAGCALFTILVFTVMDKSLNITDVLSLSLVLGGGLGNLTDRLFKDGVVVDFMIISLGSLKTAIFNFADLSIVTGLLLLALLHIPWHSRPRRTKGEG
jgi:signal peptidase II